MAGRCISVTHEALGTVRVMKTCGMMGEVVGKAASICVERQTTPRGVYQDYLPELLGLLELPGKAYRNEVGGETIIPDDALELAGPYGPASGLSPSKMKGLVIDDRTATLKGSWTVGTGLKGYVGWGYRYASPDSGAEVTFTGKSPKTGVFDIHVLYGPHPNRGTQVPVSLSVADGKPQLERVDMKGEPAAKSKAFVFEGVKLAAGQEFSVTVGSEGAGGTVHADAIQVIAQ